MPLIRTVFSALWKTFFLLVTLLFIGSYFSSQICSLAEKSIALPARTLLASFFGIFPFSFFELCAILLVPGLIVILVRYFKGAGSLSVLVGAVQFLFVTYALTLGINGAEAENITEARDMTLDERISVMNVLCEQLEELSVKLPSEIENTDSAVVNCVGSYLEESMNIKSVATPRIKAPLINALAARLGLEAYYAFPTAEIIVNSEAPIALRTFDVAHELMHFYGIVGEDSATYFAFCAMEADENPTVRYCASLYAFCLIGAKLYRQSADDYYEILSKLPPRVTNDLEERAAFFEKIFSSEAALAISQSLNDAAISMRDSRGAQSYAYAGLMIENFIFNKYCN